MKKFALMFSLLLGLSIFTSCTEDKEEPVLDFKLSQNDLSLIVDQSLDINIESGNAPYTISNDEHVEATIKGKVLTVKALQCDAIALKATPVKLTLTDKAGKKQEIKIDIYNTLSVAMQDVEAYEGSTADVRINAGKLEAFKLKVKDESIATAEIASEMIGDVELKKILINTKAVGETELTVTDGITTTKPIKIVVKEITPVGIWGAVQGELKKLDTYTLKEGEDYNFTLKGGKGKFVFEYDEEKLVLGEVQEHDEVFVVKIAPNPNLKKSQDVKLKISQKEDPSNVTELTIKVVIPEKVFGFKLFVDDAAFTPAKDNDGDDIAEISVGQKIRVEIEGGSGKYYVTKSSGDELLALGATGLVEGKYTYGKVQEDGYLIPSGSVEIQATRAGEAGLWFRSELQKEDFVSKEAKYLTIKIK